MSVKSLEGVAVAAKTHLENEFAAALDTVEAIWVTEGDPITLTDVATWLLGDHQTILDSERATFPVMTTVALLERRGEVASQWGFGEGLPQLIVAWVIAEDTAEESYKVASRYGQAVDIVIRAHRRLATGIEVAEYVPETEISFGMRKRDKTATASDEYYVRTGQKTYSLKMSH